MTYLFSPRANRNNIEIDPTEEEGTGSIRGSDYETIQTFLASLPTKPASVWRCVQWPDHLASVLASPVLATVAGNCAVASAEAAPRLGQWALHSLRRACLAAAPRSPAPGRAVVAALARFGRAFRELPPCVEVFFPALLSRYNPLRRRALALLAWAAPEAFPAARGACHAVLAKWLGPSLRECYHHRDMALALLALADLLRRIAGGGCCCSPRDSLGTTISTSPNTSTNTSTNGNNSNNNPTPIRLFRHSCVVPGVPGWSPRPGDPAGPCLLRHVAAYARRAAGEVADTTHCHAEVQDALLALCEALADVAGRCPAAPARAPRDLLLALFHTPSAVAVSRALGAVVAFDKAGADLLGLDGRLRAELADRTGAFSLVAHPALAPFVAKFIDAVNSELAKGASERSEDDSTTGVHGRVTPTNILDDHVEAFLTFLAARRLTGLVEFFSRWPIPASTAAAVSSLSTEMDY